MNKERKRTVKVYQLYNLPSQNRPSKSLVEKCLMFCAFSGLSLSELIKSNKKMKDEQRFLSIKEVQGVFNISRSTEKKWRDNGDLPQPIKMGKLILYKTSDIEKISK